MDILPYQNHRFSKVRRPWGKDYLIFSQGQQIFISRLRSLSQWGTALRRRLGKTILTSMAYRINIHYLLAHFGVALNFLIHRHNFFEAKDAPIGDSAYSPLVLLRPAWAPTLTGLSTSGGHAIATVPFHKKGTPYGRGYYIHSASQKGSPSLHYLLNISPDKGTPFTIWQGTQDTYRQRNGAPLKPVVVRQLSRHEGYGVLLGQNSVPGIWGVRKEGMHSSGSFIPFTTWQGTQGTYRQRNKAPLEPVVVRQLSRHEVDRVTLGQNSVPGIWGVRKEGMHSNGSFIHHPRNEGKVLKEGSPVGERALIIHDILLHHQRNVTESANGHLKNAKVHSGMITDQTSIPRKFSTGIGVIEQGKKGGHFTRVEDVRSSTTPILIINAPRQGRLQRYVPLFSGRREMTDPRHANTVYPISPCGQTERRAEAHSESGPLHPQGYPQPAPHEVAKTNVFETTVTYHSVYGRKDTRNRGISIDYQKVADHVYDILTRRIVRERERMEGLL